MAHTTLPAAHSEADLALAQQLGERLQLRELHVFWTLPLAKPARRPVRERGEASGLTGAFAALGALFERIGDRLALPRR